MGNNGGGSVELCAITRVLLPRSSRDFYCRFPAMHSIDARKSRLRAYAFPRVIQTLCTLVFSSAPHFLLVLLLFIFSAGWL